MFPGFCIKKFGKPSIFLNIVLVVLYALAITPVSAAPKEEVVRIVSFSFPPILHATESGRFSGTMGETIKMLCEAAEIKCKFSIVPLKRAYQQIRAGDADALITINVGQLKECCIPSEWASPWTAGFFSSKGRDAIPDNQDQLRGKSLIVVQGMKSPYFFAKDLDSMSEEQSLTLFKAPGILSSVKMFLKKRAPLLWGGEDFKWYIHKVDKRARYEFKPFFEKPVVVWIRKDRQDILANLNTAFSVLHRRNSLDEKNLLIPSIMEKRYVDAPFKY